MKKITDAQIKRFTTWLTAALPRGRSVREYVETFGGVPVNQLVAAAIVAGHEINVYPRRPGSTRHRIKIIKQEGSK